MNLDFAFHMNETKIWPCWLETNTLDFITGTVQ